MALRQSKGTRTLNDEDGRWKWLRLRGKFFVASFRDIVDRKILNTTSSPANRKQVNVKQAKGTSASSAEKHSLGALQTVDVGLSITQEPKGAVPERDKRAIDAQVTASAAQEGLAICEASGDEFFAMDDEENYEGLRLRWSITHIKVGLQLQRWGRPPIDAEQGPRPGGADGEKTDTTPKQTS
ncbi:hypothetical protein CYMTET_13422 [Cymbomonas tetramitiformis]|uniref:Uncharacterized protein n=1 Tax=Cymbomonas tetramitiformis TaxID=36881 RepID=A0AAE0LAW6_9CHLO|nr:hypothetical protein CYMTET_13422 [Cymbomonas tetramitiformis]